MYTQTYTNTYTGRINEYMLLTEFSFHVCDVEIRKVYSSIKTICIENKKISVRDNNHIYIYWYICINNVYMFIILIFLFLSYYYKTL